MHNPIKMFAAVLPYTIPVGAYELPMVAPSVAQKLLIPEEYQCSNEVHRIHKIQLLKYFQCYYYMCGTSWNYLHFQYSHSTWYFVTTLSLYIFIHNFVDPRFGFLSACLDYMPTLQPVVSTAESTHFSSVCHWVCLY